MSTKTTPKSSPSTTEPANQPEPAFGWTAYAEQINGRFAMLGFLGLILIEVLTKQGLLAWLGLR
ncbi:chlorophyll a/b-binding protein [Pantanalinema rosaneae CENA516]|uniref:chlorophyll a/b-binding protein n=1 Tax=Pantanalinema rosaneae TaxID=1620701 RepID=UPI003D6E866B